MSASHALEPRPRRSHRARVRRIAPTWPLDRFIAVNPFWADRHAAARGRREAAVLSGAQLLMPRAWYRRGSGARGGSVTSTSQAAIDDERLHRVAHQPSRAARARRARRCPTRARVVDVDAGARPRSRGVLAQLRRPTASASSARPTSTMGRRSSDLLGRAGSTRAGAAGAHGPKPALPDGRFVLPRLCARAARDRADA